ncbi:hypothetical protein D3C80_1781740 [compost metagenome]
MPPCGMGQCQGRLYGATITHLLSDTCNISPKILVDLRIRPPVKSTRVVEIAAMPYTLESVFAVTGNWPNE